MANMKFAQRSLLALLLAAACGADFTSSFSSIQAGQKVTLKWNEVEQESLPVYIHARLFNQSESGMVSREANISTDLSTSSFVWENVPYPLPFYPTAEYEVEILPQNWDVAAKGEPPAFAQSELFNISSGASDTGGDTQQPPSFNSPQPTGNDNAKSKGSGKPSNSTVIAAVCVGLGIPVLAGIGVAFWCLRRQKRRIAEEERRKRRILVIH